MPAILFSGIGLSKFKNFDNLYFLAYECIHEEKYRKRLMNARTINVNGRLSSDVLEVTF